MVIGARDFAQLSNPKNKSSVQEPTESVVQQYRGGGGGAERVDHRALCLLSLTTE